VYWILIWNCLLWCHAKYCVDMYTSSLVFDIYLFYVHFVFLSLITVMYQIHDTTYVLTPYSRVLLEKLTSSQLVKKFPAFYGAGLFITAFISLHDTTANIN